VDVRHAARVREHELIAAIERATRSRGARVVRWIGDDAAVVRARPFAVTSIDTVADGVHFQRSTHSPGDVGHKALATALSDLAAMGADAGEAYVSLALPEGLSDDAPVELVRGLEALAERCGVTLAGGDVIRSPALVISVAVTGWADSEEELVGRDGADAGQLVGVTGELGAATAGLLLLQGADAGLADAEREALVVHHLRPEPRLAAGRVMAAEGASAMIDVSDGVAADAAHLAEQSGVEVIVRLADLPLAPGVEAVARATGRDPIELAAAGGDDYELLVCAPPERREALERVAATAGAPLTWLGETRAGAGAVFTDAGGGAVEGLAGYEHG
jgi:thiamine-monophosphate kinase